MKILVVQDHLRNGGTERQSVFLANAFAAAGHAATLLTFRPGGRLAATVGPGVRHETLQWFDTGLDFFAPRLRARATASRPDVVLCMGRMANCHGASLAAALPGASVLATMRTGKALPFLYRRSLVRAAHVVANSVEARDTLVRDHGVSADRVSVIYNSLVLPPPTAPDDAAARASLRATHGADAATTVLLCVAMFRREKNQRALIEAVAELPSSARYQLWLAGDGPARSECAALAAARRVGDRVKFLGFQRDPSPWYAAADVAVHASWSDALSNFVIESQAHGLPAVVFEAQGMRECVIPDRTGWVIPRGETDAFRACLLALMKEPEPARIARAAEARAFARQRFDPARQVRAYLTLFERLSR